jgi:hypothetical protein
MVTTICNTCGGELHWNWPEAFDRYGFGYGYGDIETWQVADVLTQAGYEVQVEEFGPANPVILSIKKDGQELIPEDSEDYRFGYEHPRDDLPQEVVALLDENFPPSGE